MRMAVAGLSVLVCLTLTAGASELELVKNGDFEAKYVVGWEHENQGIGLSIEQALTFDPDPDFEVRLSCSGLGSGTVRLWQTVLLPASDAEFSASLSTSAIDGGGAWCAAGLVVAYVDDVGAELGRTFLGSTSSACPWTNGPAFHLIDTTGDWQDYSFTLADELLNLPGVDAGRISQLEVALLLQAENC
jgi:hypothetical protein